AKLVDPIVYHLLGRVSASPDYVVTEEDTLEFVSALQSESRRPNTLFDDLKSSHLLILGCNLSNWLARFFLRTTKGQKLSLQRDQGEIEVLVDASAAADHELVVFLGHFSPTTRIMPWNPREFVSELHRRWSARQRPAGIPYKPKLPRTGGLADL